MSFAATILQKANVQIHTWISIVLKINKFKTTSNYYIKNLLNIYLFIYYLFFLKKGTHRRQTYKWIPIVLEIQKNLILNSQCFNCKIQPSATKFLNKIVLKVIPLNKIVQKDILLNKHSSHIQVQIYNELIVDLPHPIVDPPPPTP